MHTTLGNLECSFPPCNAHRVPQYVVHGNFVTQFSSTTPTRSPQAFSPSPPSGPGLSCPPCSSLVLQTRTRRKFDNYITGRVRIAGKCFSCRVSITNLLIDTASASRLSSTLSNVYSVFEKTNKKKKNSLIYYVSQANRWPFKVPQKLVSVPIESRFCRDLSRKRIKNEINFILIFRLLNTHTHYVWLNFVLK